MELPEVGLSGVGQQPPSTNPFINPQARTAPTPEPVEPPPIVPTVDMTPSSPPVDRWERGPTLPPTARPETIPNAAAVSQNPFINPNARVPASYSADEIRNDPIRMEEIRNYMVLRKGVHMEDYSDEELYDAFVTHQRWFSTNEVSTVSELLWVNNLSEEDKAKAATAYGIFDSLGSVFTNDGPMAAFSGVKDYMVAAIASPSTIISLGMGKLVTGAATATARAEMIRAATAAVTVSRAAPAGSVAAINAGRTAIQQVAATAARSTTIKEIATATVVDAGAASLQDIAYQSALINSGYQDEYNGLQTILSAGLGVVGGVVSAVPVATRQRGLTSVGSEIMLQRETANVAAAAKAAPLVQTAAANFQKAMIDWLATARKGQLAGQNDNDFGQVATQMLLDTDPNSTTSIVAAMMKAGYKLDETSDTSAIHQIASFGKLALQPKQMRALNKIFKANTGHTFNQTLDIMVNNMKESGQSLNLAARAAKALKEAAAAAGGANATIAKTKIKANVDATPEALNYVQSVWRRALVSHIATTSANVAGWAQLRAFGTVAQLLHGGTLGTAGLAAKLISPLSAKSGQWADKALLESSALFKSQVFKLRTLLDPFSTKDAFMEIMPNLSKSQRKELSASLFGGTDGTPAALHGKGSTPDMYNMPDNRAVRYTEVLLDKAATVSLLKVQDVYTKAVSFMDAVNLGTLRRGMGTVEKVLADGKWLDIPPEVFDDAIKATLKDTMSFDYTKGYGQLSKLAKIIEGASNTPGIGFLFPFGRFLNNQLAFIMEWSPMALIPLVGRARKMGLFGGINAMESLSKMAVGTYMVYTLAEWEKELQAQGLQWYEQLDSTGGVTNRQNLAPISAGMIMGRMIAGYQQGYVAPGLWVDLAAQMGPISLLNTTDNNLLGEMAKFVNELSNDDAGFGEFAEAVLAVGGATVGNIISGFTRPIEPINATLQMAIGDTSIVDRNQFSGPEKIYRGALRYVDRLFGVVLGEMDPATGIPRIGDPKQDATEMGPALDPNPLGRFFGNREQQPLIPIDRILGMVNKLPWSVQERSGIPEWDALYNEMVTPKLNFYATQLMSQERWKQASLSSRTRMVDLMLTQVREEVNTFVETELGASANILKMRKDYVRLPVTIRNEAKTALGIDVDDRELSMFQIQMLTQYVSDVRAYEKQ